MVAVVDVQPFAVVVVGGVAAVGDAEAVAARHAGDAVAGAAVGFVAVPGEVVAVGGEVFFGRRRARLPRGCGAGAVNQLVVVAGGDVCLADLVGFQFVARAAGFCQGGGEVNAGTVRPGDFYGVDFGVVGVIDDDAV